MTRSTNMEHVEVLRDIRNWMASVYWDSRVDALDAAIAALSAPQSGDAESKLAEAGVFAGHHGLRGLADADEFWEKQPYGTRLYYGDGGMDYLHRGVLQKAVEILDAAPQPPAEAQPVACDEDRFEQFLQAAIARSPEPLRELGEYLAGVLDDDQWPAADRLLLQLATATPSAPVGVDGVKCPWDGGSPCVEPRPIGMVYPMKPAPRASGYLDGSGVEWNAWDAEQMEAYARAAYSDGWEAGYRSALAQQPAAVDDLTNAWRAAFVEERATRYLEGGMKIEQARIHAETDAARIAALAAQPGGSDNDR